MTIENDDHTGTFQRRPSLRVAQAAIILSVDTSTIYKMIRTGTLEAHRVGKRGVRVFADSLSNFQDQQRIISQNEYQANDRANKKKAISTKSHAHTEAITYLRSIGCL